jgi:hypothetical protein
MNRHVSIDTATILERSVDKEENRRIALRSSILIVMTLATIAFVALISDASLTPEQRIALYSQSGTFP